MNGLEKRLTGPGKLSGVSRNGPQGGKRLGDEKSGSQQKGVMQWTGIELGAKPKFKFQRSKFKILTVVKGARMGTILASDWSSDVRSHVMGETADQ